MFIIEDERHSEWQPEHYQTYALALAEVHRRTTIPWNEDPNVAPCMSWRTCGCRYVIQEWDDTTKPWILIKSTPIVEIDSKGVRWEPGFNPT